MAFRITKWVLFVVILAFVGWKGWTLWNNSEVPLESIYFGWLIPAGILYVIGWIPCVIIWYRLLCHHDHPVRFVDTIPAHYCGHLGKYVPGKAMVLVIRASMVKPYGVKTSIAMLTATYETLASMAVGGLLVIVLLPTLWSGVVLADADQNIPPWIGAIIDHPLIFSSLAIAAVIAGLPFVNKLMTTIAQKLTKCDTTVEMSLFMHFANVIILTVGWWIHGLSMACVMMAVGADESVLLRWPVWTLAVTSGVFMGFVMLIAPGGIGVREAFITETLRQLPDVSATQAIAAAVLLRLVWFTTEVGVAGLLYTYFSRIKLRNSAMMKSPQESPTTQNMTDQTSPASTSA